MTYLFFSCFVKEILLSSLYKKKIREILGTEFLGGTKKEFFVQIFTRFSRYFEAKISKSVKFYKLKAYYL